MKYLSELTAQAETSPHRVKCYPIPAILFDYDERYNYISRLEIIEISILEQTIVGTIISDEQKRAA